MNVLFLSVVLTDDDEQKELVHLVDERSQSIEIGARAVGLRQHVAYVQDEPAFERDQLTLLSVKYLFQAQTCGCMLSPVSDGQIPRSRARRPFPTS